jgi:conjugative transposon protein TcpC
MPSSLRDRTATRRLRTPEAPSYRVTPVRRRAAVARYGVWAVLATGPLALLLAVWDFGPSNPSPAAVAPAASPPTSPSAQPPDPAGTAATFTDLWLRADAGAPDGSLPAAVHALAPQVPLPDRNGAAVSPPVATRPVSTTADGAGHWSVIVAAELPRTDTTASGDRIPGITVRYFAVPVVSAGTAFTVTAAPAEIAGPRTAAVPAGAARTPVTTGALRSALDEFFPSFLAGDGPVDRFLRPGVNLPVPAATGFKAVHVDQVLADSSSAATGAQVPADGATVRVRVDVTATDTAGTDWPLSYDLDMAARAGRWEVSALHTGLAVQDGGTR